MILVNTPTGRPSQLMILSSSVWHRLWGTTFFAPRFESIVPLNSQVQMESNANQDPAALALQIQTLAATVEELTKQNQEIRLRLQQEDNRSETNRDNDGDS